MAEWRMTRPNLYPEGSLGHDNPSARQGHYIRAASESDAHLEMKKRHPEDSHFDCERWKD